MPLKFQQIARLAIVLVSLVVSERRAAAQQHDHAQMNMAASQGWQFMQDGVVWADVQRSKRTARRHEFVAPNWWMLMANAQDHARDVHAVVACPASIRRRWAATAIASCSRPARSSRDDRSSIVSIRTTSSCRRPASWHIDLTASTHLTLTGAPVGASRARASPIHASRIVVRQPDDAAHAPSVRLDTRVVRRRDRVNRARSVDAGGIGVQRTRT